MTKKYISKKNKQKKYKGGFFESLTSGWTNLTQKTKNWWNSSKNTPTFPVSAPKPESVPAPKPESVPSPKPEPEPVPSYEPPNPPENNNYLPEGQYNENQIAGRIRKKRTRRMRESRKKKKGGYYKSLADNALVLNKSENTAQPQIWVGGKKRHKK